MKPTTQFLTQNEIAREAGVPVSRLTAAIEAGLIQPAGRAGTHKHSPVIFSRDDLPRLKDALLGGLCMKGSALGHSHQCASATDVRAKHAALVRATEEAAK